MCLEQFLAPSKVKVKSLSCVRLFATPWTVARQAPLSMGFSRQEYWSGLPFPSPVRVPQMLVTITTISICIIFSQLPRFTLPPFSRAPTSCSPTPNFLSLPTLDALVQAGCMSYPGQGNNGGKESGWFMNLFSRPEEAEWPGFKSHPCHLPAEWLWASHFT